MKTKNQFTQEFKDSAVKLVTEQGYNTCMAGGLKKAPKRGLG